jgi:hypothetical protein
MGLIQYDVEAEVTLAKAKQTSHATVLPLTGTTTKGRVLL